MLQKAWGVDYTKMDEGTVSAREKGKLAAKAVAIGVLLLLAIGVMVDASNAFFVLRNAKSSGSSDPGASLFGYLARMAISPNRPNGDVLRYLHISF